MGLAIPIETSARHIHLCREDFFKRDWTPEEKILIILCCVLIGVIKGFLLAPIKRGIICGSNNGNSYVTNDWLEDEE